MKILLTISKFLFSCLDLSLKIKRRMKIFVLHVLFIKLMILISHFTIRLISNKIVKRLKCIIHWVMINIKYRMFRHSLIILQPNKEIFN